MINKEIIINKKTRAVINGENGDLFRLGVDGENLQENIVFKFDDEFVNGTARIELTMQDNTKSYVMINKVNETYVLPVKSIITKTGLNKMQLVITQGTDDEEIPIFKSNMFSFYIAESINADTEQPEEYPQWIDRANTTLNEIDNFDIDATKELNEATITITDRYGETKSVQIYDGENGQDGKDAKINGVNTLTLLAGQNISIEQEDDELTISAEGGSGGGAVNSVNGMTGDVVIDIPVVPTNVSAFTNDAGYLTQHQDISGKQDKIDSTHKLNADLVDDSTSTNKFTNATEKETWNAKSNFSGNYNDLTNKPDLSNYEQKGNIKFGIIGGGSTIILDEMGKGIYYGDNTYNSSYVFRYRITNGATRYNFTLDYWLYIDKLEIIKLQSECQSTDIVTRTFGYLYYTRKNGEKWRAILQYDYENDVITKISNQSESKIYDGNVMKCNDFPTPSSVLQNQIIQYNGQTTTIYGVEYVNGYFYKCVSDGQSTPTYSWKQVDIQPDKFWIGTQDEYDAITTKDANVLYFIQEV